ncbi:DNA polymerase III subunit delta, partial [Candidatus Pelagibacter sp.]|uniref:DNA polymerase III subunit delta n=1 Tax=Candidatus Pelagibacter sp. TaxID=2024849 RepID=UPI003F8613DE
MIYKAFELKKIPDSAIFYLLYGKNEGLKKDCLNEILEKNDGKVFNYEEKQIKDETESFYENILSGSLFESNKIIIINRASDKIFEIIQDLINRNTSNINIIINAGHLETRSKLRTLFEKNGDLVCIPTYPDNSDTLSKLATIFFKKENIPMSQQNINIIVDKCNGDRHNLNNELNKIKNFTFSKKKISSQEILRLINLSENFEVSELIDNCLAQNKNKIINILNENNYSSEDSIIILRTFLSKTKRILRLAMELEESKDINKTINSAKPPIFWKDKEVIKIQLNKWKAKKIKELIENINNIELEIKKNYNNSIIIVTNFILEKSRSE